jgi:hypothetical protein
LSQNNHKVLADKLGTSRVSRALLCSISFASLHRQESSLINLNRKQKCKPGNLITLIKLPGLPQYYVNRFAPSLLQEVQIFTPG